MDPKKPLEKIISHFSPESISEIFIKKTSVNNDGNQNIIPIEEWPEDWKEINFKGYPRLNHILLPKPQKRTIRTKLLNSLLSRHSCRNYIGSPITLNDISNLLFFSAGIKDKEKTTRFYPSAGGRYPLELYIIALNIKGLEKGIYHYNVRNHYLEILDTIDLSNQLNNLFCDIGWIKDISVIIIMTAIFGRTENKYKDRGLRYILIEAGHVGQNLYLISDSLLLSGCEIGGFYDLELNKILDLDGINESVVNVFACGKSSRDNSTKQEIIGYGD
jgi:SagB-type dehydrogenase family enzyme